MKRLLSTVLIVLLGILAPVSVLADEINVTIDGAQVDFADLAPTIVDGRTLVPLRGVFEALGFDVGWEPSTTTAILTRDDFVVEITIGSETFITNGVQHPLDIPAVPAQLIEGRTMLPIRAVLESVGYDVGWDGPTNTVIVSTPAPTPIPTPAPAPAFDADEFELRIFELTNAERVANGLSALIWDDSLARAARAHSIDMATTNTFSHTGSDGSTLVDRLVRAGLAHMAAAENISGGLSTPEATIAAWMNSTGHRSNILNPNMTHLGVGFYELQGSQFRFYATQKFIQTQ